MKKIGMLICLIVLMAFAFGCSERVEPGFIGMVLTPGGFEDRTLAPGLHTCYGRDRLVIIPMNEETITETLKVLCADDLNFSFDLQIRSRLKTADDKGIKEVLDKQGAKIKYDGCIGKLAYSILYDTYIKPVARSIARTIVSKYDTTAVRENREKIQSSIQERLVKAIEGTPMQIDLVVTSNFDYPDVITKAVEKKREKEIQIQQEEANQAIKLLEADNRLKIAQKLKAVRAAEAEAETAYIRIMAESFTDRYLAMKRIENDKILYTNVGKGTLIITDGKSPVMPIVPMDMRKGLVQKK